MKKTISLLVVIFWMTLIFLLSNNDGIKSARMSDNIIDKTIVKLYKNSSSTDVIRTFSKPIRKFAHFSEYFILGILVINMFNVYGVNKKIILYSLILCILYSCSDEVHQLFIDGRSCEIADIILDSSGSFCGIYLYKIIFKKNNNC